MESICAFRNFTFLKCFTFCQMELDKPYREWLPICFSEQVQPFRREAPILGYDAQQLSNKSNSMNFNYSDSPGISLCIKKINFDISQ
jgi:hypothetical protein